MITQPESMKQGFVTLKDGQWQIKPNAPQWVQDEFAELVKRSAVEPDENDIVTQY